MIRNSSRVLGTVKLNGKWEDIHPGEFRKVKEAPSFHSYNVKVTPLTEETVKGVVDEVKTDSGGKK